MSATLATKTAETKQLTATIPNSQGGGSVTVGPTSAAFIAGTPSSSTTTLTATSTQVIANNTAAATLTLLVRDQFNNVVPNGYQDITGSSTSSGSSDTFGASWQPQGDGSDTITLKSTKANADDVVTLRIGSGAAQFNVTAPVDFVAGPAVSANSSITACSSSVSTDSGSCLIKATFADANGNPLISQTTAFSSTGSSNSFSPAASGTTDNSGNVSFTFSSTKAETKTISIAVASLSLPVNVTYVAGAPASATFTATPSGSSPVYADGLQTYALSLSAVADKNGNAITTGAVSLSASGTQNIFTPASGSLGSNGTFTATLASPLVQTEQVTATIGSYTTAAANVSFAVTPWQPANTGQNGGEIYSVAIDPTNSAKMFVGSAQGLWQSTNSGVSWGHVFNTSGAVFAVAVDSSERVFYTAGTVYTSTNGGASFVVGSGLPTDAYMPALKPDPKNPGTIYAGGPGLWKSTDGGQTWTKTATAAGFSYVNDIEFDAVSGHVYVVDYYIGMLLSVDSGATFSAINGDLAAVTGSKFMTIDTSTTPPTFYYSNTNYPNGAVWSSVNSGVNWTKISSWPNGGSSNAFVIDPNNTQDWYTSGNNGPIYYSNNAGFSWSYYYPSPYEPSRQVIVDTRNHDVWAVTAGSPLGGAGLYESTNAGATWTTPNTGLLDMPVGQLVVSPANPNNLYCSANILSTSSNGGVSWTINDSGFPNLSSDNLTAPLATDAVNASEAWAGLQYYGVYATTNGGASWSLLPNSPKGPLSVITSDPNTTGLFYVGDGSGVLSLTTNAGSSFTTISSAPAFSVTGITVAKTNSSVLYELVGTNGIYLSTNAGSSSMTLAKLSAAPSGNGSSIAVDPTNASTVYASYYDIGIYKSVNQGSAWTPLVSGLPSGSNVLSIAVDPVTPTNLYAVTANPTGVYKYTAAAGKWFAADIGLPLVPANDPYFGALIINPASPSTLWIGTQQGVYKTTTGGQ